MAMDGSLLIWLSDIVAVEGMVQQIVMFNPALLGPGAQQGLLLASKFIPLVCAHLQDTPHFLLQDFGELCQAMGHTSLRQPAYATQTVSAGCSQMVEICK